MRAIVARNGQIEVADRPEPVPGPNQLLVRMRGAALNRADVAMAAGAYRVGATLSAGGPATPPPEIVLGGDVAGEVVALGPGADAPFATGTFAVGDRVMAMARGCYAEFVLVDAARAFPVPVNLSCAEAAAVPVTFCTAHDALRTAGRVVSGESVLVNAASSGVGVAALQLARLAGAGTIVACSTSAAKLDALAAAGIGFDAGVVAGDADVVGQIVAATGGKGVDVVIDSVAAAAWPTNLAAAALGGRIVQVGRLGGRLAEVDFDEVARKRVSLVGVTFRTRSAAEAGAVAAAFAADALPAFADGRLRALVDRTFPLEEAAHALAQLTTDQHLGKIVLVGP